MVDLVTASCSGPVAAEQAQIINPPPSGLAADAVCFC